MIGKRQKMQRNVHRMVIPAHIGLLDDTIMHPVKKIIISTVLSAQDVVDYAILKLYLYILKYFLFFFLFF